MSDLAINVLRPFLKTDGHLDGKRLAQHVVRQKETIEEQAAKIESLEATLALWQGFEVGAEGSA